MRRPLRFLLFLAAFLPAGASFAQETRVVLYEGTRLTGERIALEKDVFDLNETPFGARRTSSVDVARGCRATLFELVGYRGTRVELTERDNDLGNTSLGRRSVASVRVDCGGRRDGGEWDSGGWGTGGRERGVTLFRDARLEGPSETFDEDVPDLARTRFGARRASSIEVPAGCVATLFSEADYRGRSTSFRETDENLRDTDVGNDAAASLRVDCGSRPRRGRGPRVGGSGEGVTLFADRDYRGRSETFRSDVSDLSRTDVGARSASSLSVPPGCRVTLYSEPGFRGREETFDGDEENLRETSFGNDAAQSLRVECSRRR